MNASRDTEHPKDAKSRLQARISAALDAALEAPLAPGLYLVATPIGNLADMTLRGLAVLERADMVLCEDTRHSRKLVTHFGLGCSLQPYHEHNAAKARPHILTALEEGKSVALVSDAGTPLVSDPGYKLARAALDAGHAVHSVPGASAALAALTASGLPCDHFFFEGFLPPRAGARKARLEELAGIQSTLIFYEAPSRLAAMLSDAAHVLGPREGAIAKELTKLHEAVARGTLEDLVDKAGTGFGEKGEFVVLAAPAAKCDISDDAIRDALEDALARASLRDAARDVAERLGVKRTRVYALGLALQEKSR